MDLFSNCFFNFCFIFWEISSILYINTSINYFCYLKNFPRAIILCSFLGRSILSLLDRCLYFTLSEAKDAYCFKKYPSAFHIACFPFWFAVFLGEGLSQLSGDPFAVLSYLKMCHYKGIGKVYVNWKSLSVGGFHCRLIKWGYMFCWETLKYHSSYIFLLGLFNF